MNTKEIRSNNKACDKKVSKPIYRHFSGVKFFTCPSNFYQESFAHWFDLSKHFENGNMALDIEAPNKNIEAMNFVTSLRNNYQNEKMREARA